MTITLKKNYDYDRDELIRAFIIFNIKEMIKIFLGELLELEEKI